MRKRSFWRLLASLVVCQIAGVLGSFFSVRSISEWYPHISKPWFTPPDWVFAPVWTLLFLFMGIAAFLVWEQVSQKPAVKKALKLFLAQLALNVLWSAVFFGQRSITGALVVIVFLWIAIFFTIRTFLSVFRPAAVLLLPYIIWVSYAFILNVALVALN